MSLVKFANRLMSRAVRPRPVAPIRTRTRPVGRAIEQLEDRVNPVISLSFVGGVATFTSDSAGDTLQVQATANPADILYNSGGIGLASLNGVTQLVFNGNAGNDLFILASPPGTMFAPSGVILYNAGGQAGDELALIGGASTWTSTYNPTSTQAGLITFTNTPGSLTQGIVFGGLPTIRNSMTAASLSVTTPNVPDTINVFAGPNLGNIGAVQQGPVLIDGGDRDDHGSFGGAQNIWTFTTNQNLEASGWDKSNVANITNSTTVPHTSVTGTGNSTVDFYRFDVTVPGSVGTFDIDGGTGFDSYLAIFDHHGDVLFQNDDAGGDPGSPSGLDSFITYTFADADTYYVAVTRLNGSAVQNGFPTANGGVPAGASYTLHVSIANHPLVAGPVVVPEVEPNQANAVNPAGNQNGWKFMEQALDFVRDGAFNAGATPNSVLAIGVTGSTALAAINSAAAANGMTVTTVTGAAISTINFNNFRVLYVPSSSSNTSGGISQADLNLLNARAVVGSPGQPSVRDFINSGGGIFALTEDGLTNPYGWLQIPSAFTIQAFGGGGISNALRKTPAAISAGLTISDGELSNGVPYHNVFTGPVGFNNLLPFVLDTGPNNVVDGLPASFGYPGPFGDDRVVALGLGAIMNPGLGGAGPSTAITFGVNPAVSPQYPQMFVSATPVVNVNGAGGADAVNIGVGTPVLTAVNVNDSGINPGDVVNVFGTAGNDTFNVNTAAANTVRWSLGGPVLETITYANVEQLTINGPTAADAVPTAPTLPDGSDTFTVTPNVSTAITVNGGRPVQSLATPVAPGDQLNLVAVGLLVGSPGTELEFAL